MRGERYTLHSASYRKESGLASVPPMHRRDQGILNGESAFRIMPRSLAVCSRCRQKIDVPGVDRCSPLMELVELKRIFF